MKRNSKVPKKHRSIPSPKRAQKEMHAKDSGKPVDHEQVQHFANRIALFLKKADGRPVSRADLAAKCRGRGKAAYLRALKELEAAGTIAERRTGYVLAESAGFFRGVITRISRTFGFAKNEQTGTEVFIAGRELKGAMPGDLVLLRPDGERDGKPEAAVVKVITAAEVQTSGMLTDEDGTLRFLPDTLCKRTLTVVNADDWAKHAGEKVIATIVTRGERHSEHQVRIDCALGSADTAKACAHALAAVSGAPLEFSQAALDLAASLEETGISEEDLNGRLDLRGGEPVIFTIDGAGAKDLDDAISIEKTAGGYRLGVHIADVSHYVQQDSVLDNEAIARGTSIYFADQVIPMLPKALSNGICSLHPDVDRLAFSALMELSADGTLRSWEFRKTVIRSQVKGVYREVNALLDGTADAEITEKYAPVHDALLLLDELREKRLALRVQRGAPAIEAEESVFLLDENGVCTDILPRKSGKGEELIEECMLLANEAAARTAKAAHLPFVYRVHAQPPEEKALRLAQMLDLLNIKHPLLDKPQPKDYAQILKNAADTPLKAAVHQMVLRSMAKADYETDPIGHFGLALADYAHFTSPIRRYPDLSIHRILTAHLEGADMKQMRAFAEAAAQAGTSTEQRALQLERDCDDRYRAEWAKQHVGEDFEGAVSGVTDFGVYVMLDNTAEGMIPYEALPEDEYACDGFYAVRGMRTGAVYALGDRMKVRCVRADVNSGQIDFVPAG